MKNKNLLLNTLFDAVIRTVNLHGFHGSSIAIIAKEAKMNASNIYHYFSSKDELIISTYIFIKEKVDEFVFQDAHFLGVKSIEQRFKIIFKHYIRFYQNKSLYISFVEQFSKSPYLKLLKTTNEQALNGKITQFLEAAILQESFATNDIRFIKTLIFGAINELTFHIFLQDTEHQDQKIENTLQMLWNALTTPITHLQNTEIETLK